MNEPARKLAYTFADYIALEQKAEIKHDFIDGEIIAMSGGTLDHSRLVANIIGDLGVALAGKSCAVFTSDLLIRVKATGAAMYPDASVVCTKVEVDAESKRVATNPVVIVEVLSDSTEDYDRRVKWKHYRRIESLRAFVLVSQKEPWIEVFTRNEGVGWTYTDFGAGETLRLEPLGVELSVDAIYHDPLAARPAEPLAAEPPH